MSAEPPLILVVDDDASVRRSLGRLLRTHGFRVELVERAAALWEREDLAAADCLVLDVQLPDLNGLELQTQIVSRGISVSIIFITGHGNIPMSVKAIQAGAVDFLPKPFRDRDLLDAVRRGVERSHRVRAVEGTAAKARELLASLTPREQEVMALVVGGLLNKQIAAELGASEATIKVHRGRVMQKLQVTSVADLVRLVALARGSTQEKPSGPGATPDGSAWSAPGP